MNEYQFKVAKLQGEFIWHSHKDTDETFHRGEGICGSTSEMVPFTCLPARCSCSKGRGAQTSAKRRSVF
jgi:hypothetical protein